MIGTDALVNAEALLAAEPAVKIATALAWNEHFSSTKQSQRDEWARAFGRHLLHYISTTTRPN